MVKRINFVVDRVSDTNLPGVRSIVGRVANGDQAMTPEAFVDRCLEHMGPVDVSELTRQELVSHAEDEGPVSWANDEDYAMSAHRVSDMLSLIAATTEYQFG